MGNYWSSNAESSDFSDYLVEQPLDDDLRDFMEVQTGACLRTCTRTDLTRAIVGWAHQKELFDQDQNICCDLTLAGIIGVPVSTVVDFKQIQDSLSQRFQNQEKNVE